MRDEILKRRDDGQRIRTNWVQQRAIELVEQKDQANVDAFVASGGCKDSEAAEVERSPNYEQK